MKKPNKCGVNIDICENCRNWEPIPFHDNGGACIPLVEVMVIEPMQVLTKGTEVVPVAV